MMRTVTSIPEEAHLFKLYDKKNSPQIVMGKSSRLYMSDKSDPGLKTIKPRRSKMYKKWVSMVMGSVARLKVRYVSVAQASDYLT